MQQRPPPGVRLADSQGVPEVGQAHDRRGDVALHELLDGAFRTATIDCTWPASEGPEGLSNAVQRICLNATDAVLADNNILILSDRAVGADRIPVPALLATAAVHHHLVRQGLRMQTGLVVETGEAREVHHFCVLAGYGAEAINPYLAFAAYVYAGLDGIKRRLDPGEPNLGNLYEMSLEEMTRRKIRVLPQSLTEALDELERDEVIQAALGPIAAEFLRLKRMEWNDYHRQVSAWEVDRYLTLL